MVARKSKQTARDLINAMIKAGLRFIPLEPGGKQTFEPGWSERPGESSVERLAARLADYNKVSRAEVMKALDGPADAFPYNIGSHNRTSSILILDPDDEQAMPLLQRAIELLSDGKQTLADVLATGLAWRSVKGVKYAWNLPGQSKLTRAVRAGTAKLSVATFDAAGKRTGSRVIFELRTTGQDAMPPSTRADADGFRLQWVENQPIILQPAPKVLQQLHQALATRGQLFDELVTAAGGDPMASRVLAMHESEYPPALAAHPNERMGVNGKCTREGGLARWLDNDPRFERRGKRYAWVDSGRGASPGILPPNEAKGYDFWQCFDANCPLVGHFDAWRYVVEMAYDGNLDAALKGVRDSGLGKQPSAEHERDRLIRSHEEIQPEADDDDVLLSSLDIDAPLPEPDLVLTGSLQMPASTVLLCGPAKQGKTYLTIAWALVAAGWLSEYGGARREGEAGNVLIVGPDMSETQYRRIVKDLMKGHTRPAGSKEIAVMAGSNRLVRLMEQFPEDSIEVAICKAADSIDARYVLVDSLLNLATVVARDDGVKDLLARQLLQGRNMREARNAYCPGALLIVLHYTKKNSRLGFDWVQPQNEVSGTGALAAGFDGVVLVSVLDKDRFTSDREPGRERKVRMGLSASMRDFNFTRVLEINQDAGTAECISRESPGDYVGVNRMSLVLGYVANHQDDPDTGDERWVPSREVAQHVASVEGVKTETVAQRWIPRLAASGFLESKTGPGGGLKVTAAGRDLAESEGHVRPTGVQH